MRQTDRQMDRDRQADTQTDRDRQTDRHTDRLTGRQTDCSTAGNSDKFSSLTTIITLHNAIYAIYTGS